MSKRIICIHAHPDDAELFAAGTLAILAAHGHAVTIVTMTPGDCGSKHHSPAEIAAIRRREAADAAAVIGANYFCAEFRDLAIFESDDSRRRVTALLRRVQPDIVLTASTADYHCDHEATSRLVRDACFAAPAPNYDTSRYSDSLEPMTAIPHLYFVDPVEGRDRDGNKVRPDFVVNVEPVMDTKRKMFDCHESQKLWLQEHHGIDDFLGTLDEWAANAGSNAGFVFGEGFRQYKCHPYPTSPLLEELLGSGVIGRPAF
jgi:N-acetylglucosamine malate deacetylase 1